MNDDIFVGTSEDYERTKASLFNIDGVSKTIPKKSGFTQIDTFVLKNLSSKIGANAYAVYLVLMAYMNSKTHKSFPKQDTLSEKTGLSKVQIIRAVNIIESNGIVRVQRRHRKANIYHMTPIESWKERLFGDPDKEFNRQNLIDPMYECCSTENEYWINELHKERDYVQPVPDYKTKDIYIDFSTEAS